MSIASPSVAKCFAEPHGPSPTAEFAVVGSVSELLSGFVGFLAIDQIAVPDIVVVDFAVVVAVAVAVVVAAFVAAVAA